ncbi:MAG TPA: hypothetical protein VLB80_00285 [Candidatus Babeliales bacterium]|nr:hypothetical protein [Candidatus Babeliales bacterium]
MTKNITLFFFLSTLLLSSFHLHAIQPSTAKISTAITFALCVSGSYILKSKIPTEVHPAIFGSMSCLVTTLMYYILYQATPVGRIKRANNLLKEITHYTLATTHFDDDIIFFDKIQDLYLTFNLPIISAHNDLVDLVPIVHYAIDLINKASADSDEDEFLQKKCDISLSHAITLFHNISNAIKRIRNHKDYLSQLNIHRENIIQEQQTIAQQQMAYAQQQAANAQQDHVILKWLKFLLNIKK